MIRFRPLDPETDLQAVLRLSREQFGAGAYQADRAYLEWLYTLNPAGRGFSDCLVAVQDDVVVGVIHRMILGVERSGMPEILISLQNHFMVPAARAGAGMMLLNRATKGANVAFSPGVQGRLAEAYRRLGYREIPSFWLTRPLNAVLMARDLLLSRLQAPRRFVVPLRALRRRHAGLELSASPDDRMLTALAASIRSSSAPDQALRMVVSAEVLEWRYFCASGPRHLLVRDPASGAVAVLAFGYRRGLKIVRLMEFHHGADAAFAKKVLAVARTAGASFALAFTLDRPIADTLIRNGFRLRGNDTAAFASSDAEVTLGPAATDVGFEAFMTDVAE